MREALASRDWKLELFDWLSTGFQNRVPKLELGNQMKKLTI
jgi:hypothetical protein